MRHCTDVAVSNIQFLELMSFAVQDSVHEEHELAPNLPVYDHERSISAHSTFSLQHFLTTHMPRWLRRTSRDYKRCGRRRCLQLNHIKIKTFAWTRHDWGQLSPSTHFEITETWYCYYDHEEENRDKGSYLFTYEALKN